MLRLLAEVSLGTGALSVIGGTVGVIAFLAFFTGTEVGLQGYQALDQLGTGAFTGFISAYFNTREIAPLVAGLALAATVGCGFTAQLGAMRISEEIDALEVMGIPSLPFLVTDPDDRRLRRRDAALRASGCSRPTAATRFITTAYFGQSKGTYDHYFHLFLPPGDVLWSFVKVLVFAVVIIADPLLLRLHRQRWPGRRRRRGRQGRAHLDRRDQHRRLLPLPGHLGRHDDRADRGVAADAARSRAPAVGRPARALGRRSAGWSSSLVLALLVGLAVAIVPAAVHPRRPGHAADRPHRQPAAEPAPTSRSAG